MLQQLVCSTATACCGQAALLLQPSPQLYDVLVALLLLSCSSPAGQALLAAFLAPCAPDALLHLVCCLPDLIKPLDVEQGKA
jgi:hypothetical protein